MDDYPHDEEAQQRNDWLRDASPLDHRDEIPFIERILAGDLSSYSAIGVHVMRERLAFLRAVS